MPRPRNPKNEPARAATERWRKALKTAGAPETDAVDSALAAAVAVFVDTTAKAGVEKESRKAKFFELAAVNYLVSQGADPLHAARLVARRVHRLDVGDLLPLVDGSTALRRRADVTRTP